MMSSTGSVVVSSSHFHGAFPAAVVTTTSILFGAANSPKRTHSSNRRPFLEAHQRRCLTTTTAKTGTKNIAVPAMESELAAHRNLQRLQRHDSILQTIGSTPIIKLKSIHKLDSSSIPANNNGVNVYVKLESENPGGSIKDRLAYGVIEWAEKHGQLRPGQTVIDASSGNTGKKNKIAKYIVSIILACMNLAHNYL
jgi:Pyridoxal-phosphate dependent enzyme